MVYMIVQKRTYAYCVLLPMCPTDGPMARGARGDTLVYDIPGPGSVDLSLDSAREGVSGWVGATAVHRLHMGGMNMGAKLVVHVQNS